jgi:hypothetical protein
MQFQCTEGISYTDTEYCFYPLRYIQSYTYLNIILYKYYVGRDGQSVSELSLIKNRNDLYLLISKMTGYLKQDNYSKNIRSLQCLIMEGICSYYYRIVIIFNNRNSEDDIKLKRIDNLAQGTDASLYTTIGRYRYCRIIKFVEIWRKKNKYCRETILFKILFPLRKKILKLLSLNANVIRLWYSYSWRIVKNNVLRAKGR